MSEKIISINQGLLKGKSGKDINGRIYYAFLGIPYAKPPIGKLRFKAPQPPDKWEGLLNATKDGSACYSRDFVSRIIIGSEDCLFLNVYTPELPDVSSALKPVMVYIHGGAFMAGSNSSEMYGPEFLLTGDIVLVVINYRTSLLGFLQLDDPDVGVPGNAGCKDMVMALKWVQLNIEHFGGDPNNVTIFGESAGGASVHLLMLSSMSSGLFHKVIAQSGSALNTWTVANLAMADVIRVFNCPYNEGREILRYLQELPVQKILEGQDKLEDDFVAGFRRSIGPVIEKLSSKEPAFLSEEPLDIILNGTYNHIPLMMGYTSREGIVFEMIDKMWNREHVIQDFEKMIPHFLKIPKEYLEQCKKSCALFQIPRSRFSIDAGLNYFKKNGDLTQKGASHGDDLGYLFKTPITPSDLPKDSIELKTINRMVTLWTNFSKTGDPNPIENIIWRPISKDETNTLDIGRELISGPNSDQDRMTFWDNIVNEVLQTSKF